MTTIHASASLVLVDVVVTEHDNAVHGLDRSHFRLFEDGHEVPITYFDERNAKAQSSAVLVKTTPLPPHVYSNEPLYPDAPAVNVLLLDTLNTAPADQMFMRQQALKYLKTTPAGTQMAIFALGTRLQLLQGFTWDTSTLEAAIQSPAAGVHPTVALDLDKDATLNQGVVNMIGGQSGGGSTQTITASMQQFLTHVSESEAETESFNADERQQLTLDGMQQIARYLSSLPGRKNLIWFSDSFPMSLLPTEGTSLAKFMSMRNYSERVQSTADMLSAVHVAVYPVYAAGVEVLALSNAKNKPNIHLSRSGMGGPDRTNPTQDDSDFLTRTADAHATMERVAEQTGGEAFLNTNALAEAVAKAVENGSSYYSIGYVPQQEPKGSFHSLKVAVDGGHYQLEYRHGFYVDAAGSTAGPATATFDPMQEALLHGAPPSTQVLFWARVLSEGDPELAGHVPQGPSGAMVKELKGPTREVAVDMKINAATLLFESMEKDRRHDRLEWMLVGYDAEGRRVNYTGGNFDETLGPKDFERAMENGMVLHAALTMPATGGSVRLVVHDLNSNRVGAIEVPVRAAGKS
ncbi:VWA domain-containing protein [Silvibacterium sp.]|uniref:VWA domain-containing protein n=1 Tax=Silvibacterium sp. TaxID=1964179 RepID=UPI0039E261CF